MRPYLYFVPMLMLLLGCASEKALTFEPLLIEKKTCTDCSEVAIQIPRAVGKTRLVNTINTALTETIISMLHFDDSLAVTDLESAAQSFLEGQRQLETKIMQTAMPWEASIEGNLAYEDARVMTIQLNTYIYTGGAHGYGEVIFMNFDKEKEVELEPADLISDLPGFTAFVEQRFRAQQQIAPDAPINSTGLMFENNVFRLPQNMGFTEEGLQLYYAPYEIAAFADGPIVLTLPLEVCLPYLSIGAAS
ncbi:DUF3298 domain-containing protein [Maribacter sp. 2307ULW6-5]|uniref:DUF3298 and DUF4163 domain-containing protein n=1 Tax=Maribacter sp. 2307ULW6-5 TaxID=3386275 RepID=UPI0039BD5B8C